MANKNSEVTITIHGREYKINSVRDSNYTFKLASYCDVMMGQLEKQTGSADFIKLSVLAMLQMAHSYFEMVEQNEASGGGNRPHPELGKMLAKIDAAEKEITKLNKK